MSKRTYLFMTCLHVRKLGSTGSVKAIELKGQKTVTAARDTQHCSPAVLQALRIIGLVLRHEDGPSRTAALPVNF
ncbi:hypothetical protein EVAR_7873_1 [Eumeta japonica]|uniref:Uncharacterized protein n=1 Tax=Eumeta variegata TaxID=151549 RepID=A0A4C1TV53_EUMVA|nr:hypothetical protein EVAR_7873_1 [Eumeta japonica]